MAIEVRFITPNGGRPTFDLRDAAGNVMLHVNPRWDQHAFVLNSYIAGHWRKEERPGDFDLSVGVPMSIHACGSSQQFLQDNLNGKELHHYKHRLLPLTSISEEDRVVLVQDWQSCYNTCTTS